MYSDKNPRAAIAAMAGLLQAHSALPPIGGPVEVVFTDLMEDSNRRGIYVQPMPKYNIHHATWYFPILFRDYLIWHMADSSVVI